MYVGIVGNVGFIERNIAVVGERIRTNVGAVGEVNIIRKCAAFVGGNI